MMKFRVDSCQNFTPQIEHSERNNSDITKNDLINSPCRKRPDSGKRCVMDVMKQPKNNHICESCIYIPWGEQSKKRHWTEDEILKVIFKNKLKITKHESLESFDRKNVKIKWSNKCSICQKGIPRGEYCSDCKPLLNAEKKLFKKKYGCGVPSKKDLHKIIRLRLEGKKIYGEEF